MTFCFFFSSAVCFSQVTLESGRFSQVMLDFSHGGTDKIAQIQAKETILFSSYVGQMKTDKLTFSQVMMEFFVFLQLRWKAHATLASGSPSLTANDANNRITSPRTGERYSARTFPK